LVTHDRADVSLFAQLAWFLLTPGIDALLSNNPRWPPEVVVRRRSDGLQQDQIQGDQPEYFILLAAY
jgi:hypothetical protein